MTHLKRNFLLYCLAACILVILLIVYLGFLYADIPHIYWFALLPFSIVLFLVYLYWLTKYATRLLIIGDQARACEQLVNEADSCLQGEHLFTQILPFSLLKQESPRTKTQLTRLKGSFFCPPRLMIALDVHQLWQSNDAEILLLCTNINRVLSILQHRFRKQQIDFVGVNLRAFEGFTEFTALPPCIDEMRAELSISSQLNAHQNSSKALLNLNPQQFMSYLSFSHFIPALASLVEKRLEEFLLTNSDAKAKVYLRG